VIIFKKFIYHFSSRQSQVVNLKNLFNILTSDGWLLQSDIVDETDVYSDMKHRDGSHRLHRTKSGSVLSVGQRMRGTSDAYQISVGEAQEDAIRTITKFVPIQILTFTNIFVRGPQFPCSIIKICLLIAQTCRKETPAPEATESRIVRPTRSFKSISTMDMDKWLEAAKSK
jgi:hypothetical protein